MNAPPTAALPIADVLTSLRALCQQWAQEPDSNSGDYDTGIAHGQIECANQLGPIMRKLELAYSAPAVQATADADELAREICARLFLMTPMAGTIATISEVIRKAVSPKAAAETLEHVHIFTDKLALVTGDPADLPDSVPDDDPRRHNCDQMGCPSLDHVLYRLPFTDHRKPVDIKALARQLAESIDFTAGPVQAREAFEKRLDALVIPASPAAVSGDKQEKERG